MFAFVTVHTGMCSFPAFLSFFNYFRNLLFGMRVA
jgi:hypothetical protein